MGRSTQKKEKGIKFPRCFLLVACKKRCTKRGERGKVPAVSYWSAASKADVLIGGNMTGLNDL